MLMMRYPLFFQGHSYAKRIFHNVYSVSFITVICLMVGIVIDVSNHDTRMKIKLHLQIRLPQYRPIEMSIYLLTLLSRYIILNVLLISILLGYFQKIFILLILIILLVSPTSDEKGSFKT